MKIFSFISATVAMFLSTTAFSQQSLPEGCFPDRPLMAKLLAEGYGERQITAGNSLRYAVRGVVGTEFWVNVETGSYTYVFEYENGSFCIGDSGDGVIFGPFNEENSEIEGDPT